MGLTKRTFEQLLPLNKMNYMETFNASEGFFGVQEQPGEQNMLLMLDYGIYYEFAEASEWGNDQPQTISLSEVELGVDYEMIISTNAGLWRYRLGDTIRFTSVLPYKIQVTGRTKQHINLFGEELMVHNADEALRRVCHDSGAAVAEYTVGVNTDENAVTGNAHQWLIEFDVRPNDLEEFAARLDLALQQVNGDYEAKRAGNHILRRLELRELPKGTFYRWLESKQKLGGQHKIPRLSPNSVYLDSINALISADAPLV